MYRGQNKLKDKKIYKYNDQYHNKNMVPIYIQYMPGFMKLEGGHNRQKATKTLKRVKQLHHI